MKAIDSVSIESNRVDWSPSLRRIVLAISFGVSILACEYFIVRGFEPGTTGYWYVTICFPAFPALACIRSLKTATTLNGRDRTAWIFISLGCGCMVLAEGFWGYLEFINPSASPMTDWATSGYVFSPLLFMVGMLFYQRNVSLPGPKQLVDDQ